MDEEAREEARSLLARQAGVVARRQLIATGWKPHDVARAVRRRELTPLHDGVLVDHTGPPTWQQRAWAAVLYSWPAALTHDSALRIADAAARRDRDDRVIHVGVAWPRHVVAPDETVVVHRIRRLEERVQGNLGPPRLRHDEAVLDLADAAGDALDAVSVLAAACGSRRTTAARLEELARERPRLHRRAWLLGVLDDVANGTCSVLEHGYLDRVERRHGLPVGRRQASRRSGAGRIYRDVDYAPLALVVELDGRAFHDSPQDRDRDLERDLDAMSEGTRTVRLSYAQVFDRPCSTAERVGGALRRVGWTGETRPCQDCGGSDAPGESDPPRTAA